MSGFFPIFIWISILFLFYRHRHRWWCLSEDNFQNSKTAIARVIQLFGLNIIQIIGSAPCVLLHVRNKNFKCSHCVGWFLLVCNFQADWTLFGWGLCRDLFPSRDLVHFFLVLLSFLRWRSRFKKMVEFDKKCRSF